jgi:hypothetical protein
MPNSLHCWGITGNQVDLGGGVGALHCELLDEENGGCHSRGSARLDEAEAAVLNRAHPGLAIASAAAH